MAKKKAASAATADLQAFANAGREKNGGEHSYAALLGLKAFETQELRTKVMQGFPYKAFEQLRRNLDIRRKELADLVNITPRTLERRRREGRLTTEESDRLVRAARVIGKARRLFEGNVEAARAWLSRPAPALGNCTPQEWATTDVGAREVENLLGRLEHGVFS